MKPLSYELGVWLCPLLTISFALLLVVVIELIWPRGRK